MKNATEILKTTFYALKNAIHSKNRKNIRLLDIISI